jgi:hypothetical protein
MPIHRLRRGARAAGATTRRPSPTTTVLPALLALWMVTSAGCVNADQSSTAPAAVLLVSNGLDDTITRIDAVDGAVIGPPLPGGAAPAQLAVGASGDLLVQSANPALGGQLTYVTRGHGGWQARPVALGPRAGTPLLAGGGRYAVVAYQAGEPPAGQGPTRCRLALFALASGRRAATHDVCSGRDTVVGLAVGSGARDTVAGALAYVAVWRRPASVAECGGATGSRIVAVRLDTGTPIAVAPVAGLPGPLVLAPSMGRLGRRLYAAEAVPSAEVAVPGNAPTNCVWVGYGEQFEGARDWRVWGLDAATLGPDTAHDVAHRVRAIAVTPDGDDVFVLAGRDTLVRLMPGGGPATTFATLPDLTVGLAASDAGLATLDVFGDRIWMLDRYHGGLVQTIPTGRRPVAIVSARAASD